RFVYRCDLAAHPARCVGITIVDQPPINVFEADKFARLIDRWNIHRRTEQLCSRPKSRLFAECALLRDLAFDKAELCSLIDSAGDVRTGECSSVISTTRTIIVIVISTV